MWQKRSGDAAQTEELLPPHGFYLPSFIQIKTISNWIFWDILENDYVKTDSCHGSNRGIASLLGIFVTIILSSLLIINRYCNFIERFFSRIVTLPLEFYLLFLTLVLINLEKAVVSFVIL